MFCINCGTKLPDIAKFCFSCGTPTALANDSADSAFAGSPDDPAAASSPPPAAPAAAPTPSSAESMTGAKVEGAGTVVEAQPADTVPANGAPISGSPFGQWAPPEVLQEPATAVSAEPEAAFEEAVV